MEESKRDNMVEAIEDGKIVKVTEEYARREGLLVIKRPELKPSFSKSNKIEPRSGMLKFELYRRPLRKVQNNVVSDLVENFHWIISQKRKQTGISRKQFAQALGESEDTIKFLENGILTIDDFILINKVQSYLGINLRKDGRDFNKPIREMIRDPVKEKEILEEVSAKMKDSRKELPFDKSEDSDDDIDNAKAAVIDDYVDLEIDEK